MSYKSGFFNATESGGVYDRVYDASDFAHYFSLFVGNGVFAKSSSNLQVLADGSGMTISVQPGSGWINGYYLTLEPGTTESLTIPTANATLNRIDSVIMGLDFTQRQISLYIRSGSVSAQPVAVSLQRNTEKYELELAQITVAAGASVITQSVVKDMREDSTRCGIVKGLIDEIDTTTLFAQYDQKFVEFYSTSKTAFDTWFENLQYVLDGDVAGHLQNEIDQRLPLAGGTLTGSLILHGSPESEKEAATKQYVDNSSPIVWDSSPIVSKTLTDSDFSTKYTYTSSGSAVSMYVTSILDPSAITKYSVLKVEIETSSITAISGMSSIAIGFPLLDSSTASLSPTLQRLFVSAAGQQSFIDSTLLLTLQGFVKKSDKIYPQFAGNESNSNSMDIGNFAVRISGTTSSVYQKPMPTAQIKLKIFGGNWRGTTL